MGPGQDSETARVTALGPALAQETEKVLAQEPVLARRATVVLSGLMPEQENAARAAWCAEGLVLRRRQVIDNWVTLTLARP